MAQGITGKSFVLTFLITIGLVNCTIFITLVSWNTGRNGYAETGITRPAEPVRVQIQTVDVPSLVSRNAIVDLDIRKPSQPPQAGENGNSKSSAAVDRNNTAELRVSGPGQPLVAPGGNREGVSANNSDTIDLEDPRLDQPTAADDADGTDATPITESLLKSMFQSIRQNWSFNATAADDLRSQLEVNCNTTQLFLTTRANVQLNESLQYDAERRTKLYITPKVYERFPEKMPYLKKSFKKCSLVGSSGFLLDSKCGKSIDTADFVIRFNLATVRNFSEDVGSKTDLMTCNPTILKRTYKRLKNNGGEQFINYLTSEYPKASMYIPAFTYAFCTSMSFRAQDILQSVKTDVFFPHPRHMGLTRDFWKKSIREKRMSSGLLLFTAAMSFCEEVHLYGFWPFPEDPDGHALFYHYFDKSAIMLPPKKQRVLHHNMPEEFEMYMDLHKKGAIRLHVGKCDSP